MPWEGHVPYFFVSHARGDDDCYVEEFFDDLCTEVGAIGGLSRRSEVGFLGSDDAVGGHDWPKHFAANLSTCHVFIPLCSPRLFLSEASGKQWWIFSERLRRHAEETGREASSLLPLMWAPIGGLTDTPLEIFPIDTDQPERPLRQYLRLRSLRDRYRRFVTRLAERVVETARAHNLAPYRPMPAMSRTPSAFAVIDKGAPSLVPAVRSGRRVHFVVAAASRDEMDQIRDYLEFYGKRALDWAPYRPALDRPLADHAQAVAAGRLLDSDVADLDDLPARIEQAARSNEMVVLLVDPWTTRIEGRRRVLAEADRLGLAATAVLVPVSRDDQETSRNRDELQFDVRQTISRYVSRIDALFRADIQTPESFDADLAGVLEEGRNRIFKMGQPRNAPISPVPGDRPILRGP